MLLINNEWSTVAIGLVLAVCKSTRQGLGFVRLLNLCVTFSGYCTFQVSGFWRDDDGTAREALQDGLLLRRVRA